MDLIGLNIKTRGRLGVINWSLPKFLDAIAYLGLFLLLLGYFSLQNRIHFEIKYLPITLALAVSLFLFVFSKENNSIIENNARSLAASIIGVACVILAYMPSIVAALLMSEGDYPKYFFNVDSPYHFSQAIALYLNQVYPPESLNNLGVKFNYHYGTQLAAAELARLGITPNKAYFGVLFFGFLLSTAGCLAGLIIKSGWPRFFLVVFIPLSSTFFVYSEWTSFESLVGIESFNGGFPHLSTVATTYAIVFFLYIYLTKTSNISFGITAAILPALTLLFKSPHFFIFAFFYFGILVKLVILGQYRRINVIFDLIFILAFWSIIFYVSNGNSQFIYIGFMDKLQLKDIAPSILFFGLPIILLSFSIDKITAIKLMPFGFSIAGILIMYSSFDLYISGNKDPNIRQILTPLPFIYSGLFLAAIGEIKMSRFWLGVMLTPITILAILFGFNRIYNYKVIDENSRNWHEFVDNMSLAECLKIIPVKGSVIVTNDLTYPADNYARPMMQMQIPAIYGHQMYAGNAKWEKNFVSKEPFKHQQELSTGSWTNISELAKQYGWTHAIIFKRTPYATGSWNSLCENNQLFVAKFDAK